MIDEYAVAASSPRNSRFQRWMYWIGIVMPIGIALLLMPTSAASTRRTLLAEIDALEPAIVVWPRPTENRIAPRPPRWVTNFTKSRSAIGRPCDLANWPL